MVYYENYNFDFIISHFLSANWKVKESPRKAMRIKCKEKTARRPENRLDVQAEKHQAQSGFLQTFN